MVHKELIEGIREDLFVISERLDEIKESDALRYRGAEKELVEARESIAAIREFLER